ncbi:MAG: deoxyuridinetriphosphatase, partial [Poseidonibacter sp.]
MLYNDFKTSIKSLGFLSIEDFMKYIGVTSSDVLEWEEKDEVPYTVSLIVHLLKGEGELPNNSALD